MRQRGRRVCLCVRIDYYSIHATVHIRISMEPAMGFLIIGKPMDKWDERFCELASFVSRWSKDRNAKVGAVIFARRGGDVSIGYNGFPMDVEDSADRYNDEWKKLEMVVHAEVNAVIAAGSRAQGATIYVWGKPICARCAGLIIQSGVKRVVALAPESVPVESKWRKTGEIAAMMFKEAGIQTDFYSFVPDEEKTAPEADGTPAPVVATTDKQS
jgi:dCMP deaminase